MLIQKQISREIGPHNLSLPEFLSEWVSSSAVTTQGFDRRNLHSHFATRNTTWWTTTLLSKVNLSRIINFRTSCGANVVTLRLLHLSLPEFLREWASSSAMTTKGFDRRNARSDCHTRTGSIQRGQSKTEMLLLRLYYSQS